MDTRFLNLFLSPLPALRRQIFFFGLILFLSGCFSKTGSLADHKEAIFSHKEVGFSLSMPASWRVTTPPATLFSADFRRKDISLVELTILSEERIPFLDHYLRIREKDRFAKRMGYFSRGKLGNIALRDSRHYPFEGKTWVEIVWSAKRDGIPKIFHSLLIPTGNAIIEMHFEFSSPFYKQPDKMIKSVLEGITIETVTEASPMEVAETYRTIGAIYKNQKRLSEAIKVFKLGLLQQPEDLALHLLLGQTYFEKTAYKAALATFLSAMEISPQNGAVHKGLGESYFALEEFDKANVAIKRALSLTNEEAPLYLMLGNIYLKQNRAQEAIQSFQQLLNQQKLTTQGHLGIGKGYLSLALYEQAIFEFEQVLERRPKDKEPHCLLEKAFLEIGESKKAKEEKLLCTQSAS